MQVAAADLLDRGAIVREQILNRVAANYRRLSEGVTAVCSCDALRIEGGWYAILEVPSFDSEEALVVDLLQKDGVLTHPGYFFDFPRESYLVVSLLAPEAQFAEGLDRVLRHVDCAVARHE